MNFIQDEITTILDRVLEAQDRKTCAEVDYGCTRSSIDHRRRCEAEEAFHDTYEKAVADLERLATPRRKKAV